VVEAGVRTLHIGSPVKVNIGKVSRLCTGIKIILSRGEAVVPVVACHVIDRERGRGDTRETGRGKGRAPDSNMRGAIIGSTLVFRVVRTDIVSLVHIVCRQGCGCGVVVRDHERDHFDPPIVRAGCINIDIDRPAADQVRHIVPHEVVACHPVLMVIDHPVAIMGAAAKGCIIVSQKFAVRWRFNIVIGHIIERGMAGLGPDLLVGAVAVPIKAVGDGKCLVVLHMPIICRNIEPRPRDIARDILRQGKDLGHI